MSDQPKKVVHIITVGLSLLRNTGMSKNGVCEDGNRKKILDEISGAFDNLLKTMDENNVTTIVDSLNKLDLNEEMKLRVNNDRPEPANRFSAEITFLFQRQNELNGRNSTVKESVYLLPTDTNESKVCAEVTKQFINNHTDFKKHFSIEDIYPITGTGNKEQINTLCKIFLICSKNI